MRSNQLFRHAAALAFLGFFLLPAASWAQVFKCTDQSGKIAYQSEPCAASHQESRPVILEAPTLTEREKFNAAAYAAGSTPEKMRQLLEQPRSNTAPLASEPRRMVTATTDPADDYMARLECTKAKRAVEITANSVTMKESVKYAKLMTQQQQERIACAGIPNR